MLGAAHNRVRSCCIMRSFVKTVCTFSRCILTGESGPSSPAIMVTLIKWQKFRVQLLSRCARRENQCRAIFLTRDIFTLSSHHKRNNCNNFAEDLHSRIRFVCAKSKCTQSVFKLKRISDGTSATNFRRIACDGTDVKKVARMYFVNFTEVDEHV